jgi:hypothetical protein
LTCDDTHRPPLDGSPSRGADDGLVTGKADRLALRHIYPGDYVTTNSGVYGRVFKGRYGPSGERQLLVVSQRPTDVEPVFQWVPATECTLTHGDYGSSELCEAILDGRACHAWAAVGVSVVAFDSCGLEIAEIDGDTFPDLVRSVARRAGRICPRRCTGPASGSPTRRWPSRSASRR